MVCCLSADDEQLQHEAELFDCETCPVALASAALWPENREAWELFQALTSRWAVDLGTAPEVFRRLTEEKTAEDVRDLHERLAVVYDLLQPPKTP